MNSQRGDLFPAENINDVRNNLTGGIFAAERGEAGSSDRPRPIRTIRSPERKFAPFDMHRRFAARSAS